MQNNANYTLSDDDILIGKGQKFERIRRITGYLVGTVDRFNDGKRAEERDRVKHMRFAPAAYITKAVGIVFETQPVVLFHPVHMQLI